MNNPPCTQCGGPHLFDTVIDNNSWNRVIRAKSLPEYLCLTCIMKEFIMQKLSFTAILIGEDLDFIPIKVVVMV